jgi:transcription antitermination factor NusG
MMEKPCLYEIGQVVEYVDLANWEENQPAQLAITDSGKWFCALTNPNCQTRVVNGLYELGFRTFLPKIRKWATHGRVRRAVERPLLGRYLFIEVDHPRQNFGAVRDCRGVETLISNLGAPCPFPSHEIESLRLRYMAGEWDTVAHGLLSVGSRIRIVEGQWENLLATVTSRKGHRIDFKLHGTNQYGRMHDCSVRAA